MIEISDSEARQVHQRLITGCDDMAAALKNLLGAKKNIPEQIHSLRKLGKTLRGGFTLFGLGKSASREIQAVGRLLSERRDAVSRRNTWSKLNWKPKSHTSRAITGLLNQQVTSAGSMPPKAAIIWALERVASARSSLTGMPDEPLEQHIASGIEKLREKLIKRARKAQRRGEEDFHDFRKALKAYLGAVKFLPEHSRDTDPLLTDLADILGDENDLATLSEWLAAHGFTSRLEPELWKKLQKSREKLQDQALEKSAGIAFFHLTDPPSSRSAE